MTSETPSTTETLSSIGVAPQSAATGPNYVYKDESDEIQTTLLEQVFGPQFTPGLIKITPLLDSQFSKISSSTNFERRRGHFIIPILGEFRYVSVPTLRELSMLENKIIHVDWGALFNPGNMEGFVVLENFRTFWVTIDDIMRGVIRASREIKARKTSVTYGDFVNGTFGPKPRAKRTASLIAAATTSEQSGAGDSVASEAELADMALQDQVRSLLDIQDPQEDGI